MQKDYRRLHYVRYADDWLIGIILKEKHGVKKIDIPGWKKEQAVLHQKEEERTAQYKPLREKLDQMLNVKYWVETAKRPDQERNEAFRRKKKQVTIE